MKTADILLFDGVEVLDFAAPYEVFTLAGTKLRPGSIRVRTVGLTERILCRNHLDVRPTALCDPNDAPDWLVIPGGPGIEPLMNCHPAIVDHVARVAERASWVMSICSGALLLAKAGVLRNRRASTHHSDVEALKALDGSVRVEHGRRFVHDGNVITSDGISAALDASLYLISVAIAPALAAATAEWAEYESTAWKDRVEQWSFVKRFDLSYVASRWPIWIPSPPSWPTPK